VHMQERWRTSNRIGDNLRVIAGTRAQLVGWALFIIPPHPAKDGGFKQEALQDLAEPNYHESC
jgi:hypothetical protein